MAFKRYALRLQQSGSIPIGVSNDAVLQIDEVNGAAIIDFGTETVGHIFGRVALGTAEVDFGSTPTLTGVFTITDARAVPTSKIAVMQYGIAATSRSADENEMDDIVFRANPSGTGTFTVYATSKSGPVTGKYDLVYLAEY